MSLCINVYGITHSKIILISTSSNNKYVCKKALQHLSWFVWGEGVADVYCTLVREAPTVFSSRLAHRRVTAVRRQRHTVVFVHSTGTCRPWAAHLRDKMAQARESICFEMWTNSCNFQKSIPMIKMIFFGYSRPCQEKNKSK